jgi:hypothetical protein
LDIPPELIKLTMMTDWYNSKNSTSQHYHDTIIYTWDIYLFVLNVAMISMASCVVNAQQNLHAMDVCSIVT